MSGEQPRLENSHVLRTAMSGELSDAQLAQNDRSSWQRQIGHHVWRTATSGEQSRLESKTPRLTAISGIATSGAVTSGE